MRFSMYVPYLSVLFSLNSKGFVNILKSLETIDPTVVVQDGIIMP